MIAMIRHLAVGSLITEQKNIVHLFDNQRVRIIDMLASECWTKQINNKIKDCN